MSATGNRENTNCFPFSYFYKFGFCCSVKTWHFAGFHTQWLWNLEHMFMTKANTQSKNSMFIYQWLWIFHTFLMLSKNPWQFNIWSDPFLVRDWGRGHVASHVHSKEKQQQLRLFFLLVCWFVDSSTHNRNCYFAASDLLRNTAEIYIHQTLFTLFMSRLWIYLRATSPWCWSRTRNSCWEANSHIAGQQDKRQGLKKQLRGFLSSAPCVCASLGESFRMSHQEIDNKDNSIMDTGFWVSPESCLSDSSPSADVSRTIRQTAEKLSY